MRRSQRSVTVLEETTLRPRCTEAHATTTTLCLVLILVAALALTAHWLLIAAALPVLSGVTLARNHYRKERRDRTTQHRRL